MSPLIGHYEDFKLILSGDAHFGVHHAQHRQRRRSINWKPLIDMASAQIISALSLAPLVSDGLAALQPATDLKWMAAEHTHTHTHSKPSSSPCLFTPLYNVIAKLIAINSKCFSLSGRLLFSACMRLSWLPALA